MNHHGIKTYTTPFLLLNLCLVWISSTCSHQVVVKHQVKQENASVVQSFRGPIPKRMSMGKTSLYKWNQRIVDVLLDWGLLYGWKKKRNWISYVVASCKFMKMILLYRNATNENESAVHIFEFLNYARWFSILNKYICQWFYFRDLHFYQLKMYLHIY